MDGSKNRHINQLASLCWGHFIKAGTFVLAFQITLRHFAARGYSSSKIQKLLKASASCLCHSLRSKIFLVSTFKRSLGKDIRSQGEFQRQYSKLQNSGKEEDIPDLGLSSAALFLLAQPFEWLTMLGGSWPQLSFLYNGDTTVHFIGWMALSTTVYINQWAYSVNTHGYYLLQLITSNVLYSFSLGA